MNKQRRLLRASNRLRLLPFVCCVIAAMIASVVCGQDIFVPTPRGAGETLDTTPGAGRAGGGSAAPSADVVTTASGDRVVGAVSSMTDELLTLSGSQYVDGVKIRSSAVAGIDFGGGEEAGSDEVTLANGDRLMGRVISVAEDHVIMEAQAVEPLKISRQMIRAVSLAGGSSVLLKSGFADGRMTPWTTLRGGSYTVADGLMISNNNGSQYPIAAPLQQKEAITMIVKYKSLDRNGPYVSMMFFVDTTDSSYGRNSVFAMYNGNSYYAHTCTNGSTNQIGSGNFGGGRSLMEGELRAAYDPKTKLFTMWADTNKLGEWKATNNLESGAHIMMTSQFHTSFSEITVLRGVVPPAESGVGDAEEKRDVVTFRNKDRMAVDAVRMANDEFLLTSAYGELKCPASTVSTVAFRTQGVEEPRRRKGDVRVYTPQGQMTVQFKGLTEEFLLAESDAMGEIKLLRKGLRRIEFNIHEKGER